MDNKTLDFVKEKTQELMNAHTCCAELKAAAQSWLNAVGTENQESETKKYIAQLEGDIMPIDNLISFAQSDAGTQVFGDKAADVAAHAKEVKASGSVYCDCPACAAVESILEKKDAIL